MNQLRISDAELSELIAAPLRRRLKEAGFHTGASSADACSVALPVALDMAGSVFVEREPDGTWTFTQELDAELSSRTRFAEAACAEAVATRGARPCH